jgi:hypothetical protein
MREPGLGSDCLSCPFVRRCENPKLVVAVDTGYVERPARSHITRDLDFRRGAVDRLEPCLDRAANKIDAHALADVAMAIHVGHDLDHDTE